MVGYQMEELHVGLFIRWKSSMYGWLSNERGPCMVGYLMEQLHSQRETLILSITLFIAMTCIIFVHINVFEEPLFYY